MLDLLYWYSLLFRKRQGSITQCNNEALTLLGSGLAQKRLLDLLDAHF